MTDGRRLPRGVWVIIAFHLISFLLWTFGQTGALVSYETVAAWGFQEPRAALDPAIVEVNRGIGLADTILMMPLFLLAVAGLLRRRFFGAVASWLVFGITLYWPLVFWCSQFFYRRAGIVYPVLQVQNVIVPGVMLIIAGWGTWYLARHRALFA